MPVSAESLHGKQCITAVLRAWARSRPITESNVALGFSCGRIAARRSAARRVTRFLDSARLPSARPDDRLSSPGFAGFVVVAATTGCGRVRLREAARCDIEAGETAGQAILAQPCGLCEEERVPHLDAVVIHCRQPAALAGFYAEVLGLPVAQRTWLRSRQARWAPRSRCCWVPATPCTCGSPRSARSNPSPAASTSMCASTWTAIWTG